MTTTPTFPTVPNHDAVVCFRCGTKLVDAAPKPSGFAAGYGAFRKPCQACGLSTWYDIQGAK